MTSSVFRLGQRGTTVIFSIHQPRYSIYKMFDNLILLSQGSVVYHGPSPHALDYFSSIGKYADYMVALTGRLSYLTSSVERVRISSAALDTVFLSPLPRPTHNEM